MWRPLAYPLAMLFMALLPFGLLFAITMLFPVVAHHGCQCASQGMVTITAANQVMGHPVLILFHAHSHSIVGGGYRAVYPFPQGTLLFPRHPP